KMQFSIAANIRRIEQETRRAERERIANQTKSEFITNLSHELRTPMHAILGFARQAQKRATSENDEKLVAMLNNIQTSANRLLTLLNALLDLSKLEAGKIVLSFKNENIRKTVEHTIKEAEALAQTKDMRISVDDGGIPQIISHDHDTMVQVFMNLI